jgi:hypothetical protein
MMLHKSALRHVLQGMSKDRSYGFEIHIYSGFQMPFGTSGKAISNDVLPNMKI